jgi:hypothetical protein
MKKILFTSIVILLSLANYAQKCNYEFNGKDDFTGKVKKVTKDKIKMGVFVFLERTDETYSFRMEFKYYGALDQGIAKGTEVLFKLNDESVVKLYTIEDHMPSRQVVGQGVMSYVNLNCNISVAEVTKLSVSEIIKLRLSLGGKEFTIDIPKGKAEDLKQSASCILQ